MNEDKGINSTPVESLDNKPEDGENKKKFKINFDWMKKRPVRLMAIFLAVILVIVAGASFYSWWQNEYASIKIGDETLTKRDITKYESSLRGYYEANPEAPKPGGKDVETLARDELIMNLSLKSYMQECKVSAPTDEDLKETGLSFDNGLDFVRTRAENSYFKDKMADCLINNKKILRVAVMYDSIYYTILANRDEAAAVSSVSEIKDKLNREILPLMKEGASIEEISKLVDLDNTKEGARIENMEEWNSAPRSILWLDNYNSETSGYNDQDGDEWRFDVGKLESANQAAKDLKTVGETTPAFSAKNGEIVLMRLESITGKFSTWEEFLDHSKEKVASDGSQLVSALFPEAYAINVRSSNTSGGLTANVDIDSVRFTGNNPNYLYEGLPCYAYNYWNNDNIGTSTNAIRTQHNMVYFWTVTDNYGNPVPGVTVNSSQPSWNCGYVSSDKTDSSGKANSVATCNTYPPEMSISSIPAGYTKQSNTDTLAARVGNNNGTDDNWGGSNGTSPRNKPIVLNKTANWSADPQSYVGTVKSDKFADYKGSKEVTIYPGQSAYFYHTAAVASGSQGIDYEIQLKGSGNTRTNWNGYDGYTVNGSDRKWIDRQQNVTTNFDYRAEGPASAAGIVRSTAYTTFTPNDSDVGTTYCQWIYMSKIGHDKGSKSLIDERACVKVVARPWQLDVSSQVKSSATDDSYKDRSEDLNVTVGETVDWRHALVNSTGHQAPGLDSARGYKSFGHTMTYGTSPEDPTNRYVRFLGNGNLINIDANSTINRETSTTSVNAHSGLSTTYGQDTNGTNLNYGFNNNGQPPTSKQIKPGDVGKRFCQQAYVGQHRDASLGGALVRGNLACVYVPYDYELTPKITVPSESTGGGIDLPKERGTRVDPVPVVENPGGTATRDTRWKVSQWTVPASLEGVKSPGGEIDNTNDDPCAIFDGHYGTTRAQSGCSVTHEGTRLFNSTTTLTGQIDSLTVPDDAELGSRFCFALSISPYSLNDGQTKEEQDAADSGWRHSSPVCILVVKYPKMQVWSNGIYSAGGIRTHRSTINGETFGSWVEYEALATGRISGFASAATNKFSSESPDRLTLSNNRTDKGNWGAWNSTSVSSVISNLESRYPYGATPGSGAIFRDVPNRNAAVMSTTASRYTLSGNPYADAPGKTVIIMAGDTDIDITGDIVSRAPTDGNVSEFQQIIIIGKNIRIASHVGQVDAWLISSGDIVTCAQSASGVLITNPSFITQASCGGSLRVNGPIISNNLKSWRTGGSDIGNLDTPSEIYNQRPDTYIWAYGQSGGDGKIITTYSKELPARF